MLAFRVFMKAVGYGAWPTDISGSDAAEMSQQTSARDQCGNHQTHEQRCRPGRDVIGADDEMGIGLICSNRLHRQ